MTLIKLSGKYFHKKIFVLEITRSNDFFHPFFHSPLNLLHTLGGIFDRCFCHVDSFHSEWLQLNDDFQTISDNSY